MPSKQLTAKVRINSSQAEQKLKNIAKSIDAINRAVGKQSKAHNQVNAALGKSASTANKVNNQLKKTNTQTNTIKNQVLAWAKNQQKVNSLTQSTNGLLGTIGSKLRGIASTYLGIMGIRGLVGVSDTVTKAENKLNYVSSTALGAAGTTVDGSYSNATLKATQDSLDKMYVSSQKVRMSYQDMMSNVSKSMALAGESFGNSTDAAIRFQEVMAEAYALGGASAAEMSSSMYQMIQALGSGVLAGDELRSVREGAPLAYKAIEKFAQGVYNTKDSLKDLASDGLITSDIVVKAILNAGDELDSAFANTAQTFEQTWDQIKNAAIKAFEPVGKVLRETLKKAVDNGLIEKFEKLFNNVAKAVLIVFKVVSNTVNWIVDNWDWLQHIIVAGLIVIGMMWAWQAGKAVASAIATLMALTPIQWILIVIMAAIGVIIFAFYLWKRGTIDTSELILTCLLAIAIALLIIGIITGNIYVLIAAAIFAVLALAWAFLEQVSGGVAWLGAVIIDIILITGNTVIFVINLILGILAWCGATIYNIVAGYVNGVLQMIWSFVEPFLGIIEFILNACNGGFDSLGGAVANLIGQIISWFLTLGQVVTKIIDAIFGTDWSSGLKSLQDKVLAWGKTEDAITISRDAPEMPRTDATDAFNAGFSAINYIDLLNPMDNYEAGAKFGALIKDKINSWGKNLVSGDESDKSLLDRIAEKLGLDFSGMTLPSAGDLDYNLSSIEDLLSGIGDDTSKMSDSMDLANEELDWLRSVADMEWRKEFTTAEIKIDMTNHNTVNNDRDLDGIVEYLSDTLRSEMTQVAYGVHY